VEHTSLVSRWLKTLCVCLLVLMVLVIFVWSATTTAEFALRAKRLPLLLLMLFLSAQVALTRVAVLIPIRSYFQSEDPPRTPVFGDLRSTSSILRC
jgi:hypothetical protein